MFSVCNGAFNRSPPNATILWKLWLVTISSARVYFGLLLYFKAVAQGFEMRIPAPQAFLGRDE